MHQIPSITFCAIKIKISLSDLPPIEIIQILQKKNQLKDKQFIWVYVKFIYLTSWNKYIC